MALIMFLLCCTWFISGLSVCLYLGPPDDWDGGIRNVIVHILLWPIAVFMCKSNGMFDHRCFFSKRSKS